MKKKDTAYYNYCTTTYHVNLENHMMKSRQRVLHLEGAASSSTVHT